MLPMSAVLKYSNMIGSLEVNGKKSAEWTATGPMLAMSVLGTRHSSAEVSLLKEMF